MPDAVKSCPDCGAIDLVISSSLEGATAACVICDWKGPVSDTVAFLTTETVYSIEKVSETLMRAAAKHAAGPMIQVIELLGLSPSPDQSDAAGWTETVEECRNKLLQTILLAIVEATFNGGVEAHLKAKAFLQRRHPSEAARLYPEPVEKS